jgi:hypothetical protein
MHGFALAVLLATFGLCGCSSNHAAPSHAPAAQLRSAEPMSKQSAESPKEYVGFDRNDYPGDDNMAALKAKFAFVGYWVTPPPGAKTNSWVGKRELLRSQGWGFLVLANGRFDAQILKAKKAGTSPAELGRIDANAAIASAKSEGFPANTIIFLDQEEGGRLLAEQAEYLLAWTEAVAATDYKPGVYASGQLVEDAPGVKIDTIQDVRNRVKQGKLHEIAMFDAQDTCPPAPGCTLDAQPMKSAGEPDLTAWQYSQTPRRPDITKSCAATYAKDGSCYPPAPLPQIFLDMDVAKSADPSRGR